jgi:hypothetical protein
MKAFYKAFLAAQKEMKPAVKDSENTFYKNAKGQASEYASLESVLRASLDILHKHGIILLQPVREALLETQLIHVESGEIFSSYYPLTCKDMSDPQKFKACVTYARRSALVSVLALPEVDDDGNAASDVEHEPKPMSNSINGLSHDGTKPQASIKNLAPTQASVSGGNYVIKMGKYKGAKLSDIDTGDLASYCTFLTQKANSDNKPLTGPAKELCEEADKYLSTAEDHGTADPGAIPMPTDEDIPF